MKRTTILAVLTMVLLPLHAAQAELVGYWALDGDATDSSIFGNNGTAQGDASYTATEKPSTLPHSTQAAYLDGSGDYIGVAHSASLFLDDVISVSMWVKQDTSDPNDNAWSRLLSKGQTEGWMLQRSNTTSAVQLRIDTITGTYNGDGKENGNNQCFTGFSTATDGDWHHLAFVLDSGSIKTYFDGELTLDGTYLHGDGFGNTTELRIALGANNEYFEGWIDDVAIWDSTLTADDVTKLADGSETPLTVPEPGTLLLAALAGLAMMCWKTCRV